MINVLTRPKAVSGAIILGLLAAAALLGFKASPLILAALVVMVAAVALLRRPPLALPILVVVALLGPLEFSTGTDVKLNPTSLLVPALVAIWVIGFRGANATGWLRSSPTLPLFLFLVASLFSLIVGNALWDPAVPRGANFLLVQLAQWAIFAFSAAAFWLAASLGSETHWLPRMVAAFLIVGGSLAVAIATLGVGAIVGVVSTLAPYRAPFWMLLTALAGGQLLFNKTLPTLQRVGLVIVLAAVVSQAFVAQQEAISNWAGVGAAAATLVWLRWPRMRLAIVVGLVLLALAGFLIPALFRFAGGELEWERSGASRLVLMQRVAEVTLRNPILGLGPASYRAYANMKPLAYGSAYWLTPQINSHNNYLDLFAHGGLVGLALFAWFVVALLRTGLRAATRYADGFNAGYANGGIAALIGALVLMMLLDWILPFVYNVGFPGFQASVLVWLFLGGLVALDTGKQTQSEEP